MTGDPDAALPVVLAGLAARHTGTLGVAAHDLAAGGVEAVLAGQQHLDQVPRHLRVQPYALDLGRAPEITVAHRTGFLTGTRADTGIVRLRDRAGFTYAVFHHGSADERFLPESEGPVLAGPVGKALVEHW
ncbi:hypothetical protein [Pseudonocardia acidicola]|uniref:Uncharacterized protein n=1 Tax=Pseudonocardia acidicola TaxID=2724939 RepID=A0ABX1SBZ4_9PSEU|nr:hypothetical protein [Pseudonocardia acidicola]NMH98429.1 hypothetical protein [Pseudonocardia acidicola]